MAEATLTISIKDIEPVKRALARIVELHHPESEYAEFDYDEDDGPSPHCNDLCRSDRTCPGHTVEVQVCRECGYAFDDDGAPVFRGWPCPTITALKECLDAE